MTKTMSFLVLQILFCFFFAFFPLSYSTTPVIESTCKQTPYYDLCVSTLESDPRSSSAEVWGLALIASKSLMATAGATLYQIKTLLAGSPDPNLKNALNGCVDSYSIIKTDIRSAVEAFTEKNPKVAVDSAIDAENEAQKCESGFGGKSPISDGNKLVHDRAVILQCIASILARG